MIKTRGGIIKGMKEKAMAVVSLVYEVFPTTKRRKSREVEVTRGWEGVVHKTPPPTPPLGKGRVDMSGSPHATSIQNLIDRINNQKRYRYAYQGAVALLLLLLLLLMGIGTWGFVNPWGGDVRNEYFRSLQIDGDDTITPDVLALRERPPGVFYRVNIPAYFTDQVTFQADVTGEDITMDLGDGEIYASNLIYSLTGGTGIGISGDQELTILNTDPGSLQDIFKTITIGDQEITASGNNAVLGIQAGEGIALSVDAEGNIIIGSEGGEEGTTGESGGDVTNVTEVTEVTNITQGGGWNEEDGTVTLQEGAEQVGIGTDTVTDGNILDVNGNVGIDGNLDVSTNTTIGGQLDVLGDTNIGGNTTLNGDLVLDEDGQVGIGYETDILADTTKLAIDGDVGIGTSDPIADLHITGDGENQQLVLSGQEDQDSNAFEI